MEVHKLLAILEETINTEEGRAAIDEAAAQLVASDTKGAAPTTEVGGSAETETAAAAETEISATETPSVQPREPSPAVVVTDAAAMPAPPVAAGQTQKLEQPTVPPLPEQPTAEEARPMQVDEPEQPVRQEEPAQPVRQEEPEQPVRQEEPEQPVKREEPEQPPQAGQAGQDEQPVQPVQQEPEAPPPRENGTLAPASVDAGEGEAEQEEDAQAEEEEDDDYWRGKEKPSLNSLHRTFHIGALGLENCCFWATSSHPYSPSLQWGKRASVASVLACRGCSARWATTLRLCPTHT